MAKTPTWQRAAGKSESGGLNEKGRASLKAEGHDIKRPQPEGGARRDSFCRRMKGMREKLTSSETANDPDSRINKSLRKWNCADGGAVDPYDSVQQAAKGGPIWDKPRPKKLGKSEPLSSKEKASAKAAAKAAGRPYPNLIDNMRAARADGGEVDDRAHEFVQEQLKSGEPQVPQYNPEAGMETAKEAGRMIAGVTTPGAVADAAGYLGGPSALQNAREGNYGTAALQVAGIIPGIGPIAKAGRIAEEARGAGDVYRAVQQAARMPETAPIRAYHYSPHAFERFETGHAGSGATGTSFGHGLYFGSKEDDARMWQQRINQERGMPKESGHMYEAELFLDPNRMIDYNKYLHEQPEFVKNALINKLGYEPRMFELPAEGSFGGGKPRGDMAVPQSAGAMKAWQDAGLHGVQYYDPNNSYRGYVAFSGEPVSILRRYADGGEVEGDVQFAPDDPYAKVQEAAKPKKRKRKL